MFAYSKPGPPAYGHRRRDGYCEKAASRGISKMACDKTTAAGCDCGSGVSCRNNSGRRPQLSFNGYIVHDRAWLYRDLFALTAGGGHINKPGRYLVLVPPINGETAASAEIRSLSFTPNPGDPSKTWDISGTFDYIPMQWNTFRFEGDYRRASVPYRSGSNRATPPPGTNNRSPTMYACNDGTPSATTTGCVNDGGLWSPNLKKNEVLIDVDPRVKF